MFYTLYKICKHSLISIDFIASVYELFDNPSYTSQDIEHASQDYRIYITRF